MDRLLSPLHPGPIAGIAFDLGVSSMQLDEAGRGFSFRQDGPLDMRMSQEGATAADLIARLSERELADLIRTLGEEKFAGRVARAIAAAQRRRPLATTGELAEIVRAAIPKREPGLTRRPAPSRRCASRSTRSSANSTAGSPPPNAC